MYSPQIRDELIPCIYRAAKEAGVHMTTWVNEVVERALNNERRITDGSENQRSAAGAATQGED